MTAPSSVILTDPIDAQRAMAGAEYALTMPTLNTAFVDTACVPVACGKRVLYVVITTPLAWVTSGQATWQPYVGRTAMAAGGGAGSAIDASHFLIGAAQNLGPAAQTGLANQVFRLDPGAIAALAYPDPFLGIEFHFPSALTAGVMLAFAESAT